MISKLILVSLLVSHVFSATTAECVLRENNSSGVTGLATFTLPSGDSDEVDVKVVVKGNKTGLSGFHIHENAIISTQKCEEAGGHYNPHGKNHGGRDSTERHVGDLGNIQMTEGQEVENNFTDSVIKITGTDVENIVGKTCMVHSGEDDLGLGTGDSLNTGNAGTRVACGSVVLTNASSSTLILSFLMLLVTLIL